MKRRRRKARTSRQMREIRKSQVRELGDHRRWLWMANPETFAEGGPDCVPYRFDPVHGRLFRFSDEAWARLIG